MAIPELEEMETCGRAAVAALVGEKERAEAQPFLVNLQAAPSAVRGTDGSEEEWKTKPQRLYSAKEFIYDKVPVRDERFPDPYNMGVNAETFLYDASKPVDGKVLMMFYKRLREIDVPEVMSSILFETEKKPWDYYRDMTRQLWDEARHAMMGEVGFVSLGLDWSKLVMINST